MVKIIQKCKRCSHEWLPRETTKIIKTCPKCRSPYWDIPRKTKLDTGEKKWQMKRSSL